MGKKCITMINLQAVDCSQVSSHGCVNDGYIFFVIWLEVKQVVISTYGVKSVPENVLGMWAEFACRFRVPVDFLWGFLWPP